MTRYWLRWVKMVEIWRCENELLSALSMSWTLTPSRDAAVRSITTLACNPPCSRSVVTSMMPGMRLMRSRTRGTQSVQLLGVGIDQGELVLRSALPAADIGQLPRRPHVDAHAGNALETGAHALDHGEGRKAVALGPRLERNEQHARR